MLKNYNRYKVLKVFLDSPTNHFGLREIGRKSRLAPQSVLNYLKEFEQDGLIKQEECNKRPTYKAERDNDLFMLYQKIAILYEVHSSGLVDYLWHNLAPRALVLYGSCAKGEASEESDVDIFVVGEEKSIAVAQFEKKLGREIQLMFEKDFGKVSKEFKNNLINGIILKGYLKLFA